MQPYFIPYIGYFQLIQAVDIFVLYDDIEFTKKGWIHRNRIIGNGKEKLITIPIRKDSDYLDINQRKLSKNASTELDKFLRIIKQSYKNSACFHKVYPIAEKIFNYKTDNLFDFVFHAFDNINQYLQIDTKIIKSSELALDHKVFKGQEKVIEIVKSLEGDKYINAIGGLCLYDANAFRQNQIELKFLQTRTANYYQDTAEFTPNLSILDVMMNNEKIEVIRMLNNYGLIEK